MRIVIVGGGVVGASTAYWLSRRAGVDVLVLEQDPTYATASTTLSAASIRQQFSTPANIRLSQFGLELLRAAPERLGVDLQFKERGYLLLAGDVGRDILADNVSIQAAAGAQTALFSPDELEARFPWFCAAGLSAGALGLSGEGWFDPSALLQGFKDKSKRQGAQWRTAEADGFEMAGGKIRQVRLRSGETIDADEVVNAAGPRAARVAAWAGVSLPVEARARSVFYFECRDGVEISRTAPLTVDPSGVYFRPEGAGFICGVSPPAERDPSCDPSETPAVDWDLFEEIIWPALAARVPAFEAIKVQSAWAGYYAYNTLDQNALIGRLPECANLWFANGFSGHGLQQAAGVGRGLAELIADGAYQTLDLSVFAAERVLDGRAVIERNVI
ncbi:MAG: FAD-binding oxidoreductase [Pseudomonadota bacterium]